MNDINSELILLRFQPRWKTDIEVMVGKTNTKAKYSTCVGTRYENGLVNNFESHGASYVTALHDLPEYNLQWYLVSVIS